MADEEEMDEEHLDEEQTDKEQTDEGIVEETEEQKELEDSEEPMGEELPEEEFVEGSEDEENAGEIEETGEAEEETEGEESERERSTTTFSGYGRRVKSDIIPAPASKFLSIVCKKCKNQQTVFSKAATEVRCQKCGEVLVIPTGGEAIIDARVVRVLG